MIALVNAEEFALLAENYELDGVLTRPVTRSQLFDTILQVLERKNLFDSRLARKAVANGSSAGLRGGHILLVEDNYINKVVALELLENLGLQVSAAENGEQAVQMLANEHFDAVLMDIQMPGMDGYQATRIIRGELRFSMEELPIIAMTAHALAGDREKALAAGLNDYVSKPVDVLQLTEVLIRWLVPRASPQPVYTAQAAQAVPALVELDITQALARLGGNQSLFQRLLGIFELEHAGTVELISAALQDKDMELAHRLAHTLKGVAATIGARQLNGAARNMEQAIKQEQAAQYAAALEQMEYWLKATLQAVAAARKAPG
jgi:CheY-like chemotaxis protein